MSRYRYVNSDNNYFNGDYRGDYDDNYKDASSPRYRPQRRSGSSDPRAGENASPRQMVMARTAVDGGEGAVTGGDKVVAGNDDRPSVPTDEGIWLSNSDLAFRRSPVPRKESFRT